MSYLLIKRGGQKPSSSIPSNGNNGNHRRNPALYSAHRRPGGDNGSQGQNPSSQTGGFFPRNPNTRFGAPSHHINDSVSNQRELARNQHAVVHSGGGQLQLQRTAVTTLSQDQQQFGSTQSQGQQQNQIFQGLVSMDEVYADLQILDQQRQESIRRLASARLHQKQKKAEQLSLESKLCDLKCQNGGLRVELERAANQLSIRHRELLETQTKAERSRKDAHRFDAKLKRVVGVARLFGTYQNKIENAIIALNESETRLNFTKGQEMSKLQSMLIRRDDVIRRRDLLLKAINSNTSKARSISDDVSKIRTEITSNEQELSAAQRIESQTKLRVEKIEHEISIERTRHEEAVSSLLSRSKELDELKITSVNSVCEKKAALDQKKIDLNNILKRCNELLISEGQNGFPEPNWETDQAPSLDVARFWVRVNDEEGVLNAKRNECAQLRKNVAELDALISSNTTEATNKHAEIAALQNFAEKTSAEELDRKKEISSAIDVAYHECRDVEKLRDAILDLTVMHEKDDTDLKMKRISEECKISAIDAEIANILAEVVSIENKSLVHKEQESAKHDKILKETIEAKKMADVIKNAFDHAQRQADRFDAIPDRELSLQITQLDETEKEIVSIANLERNKIIESEPLLKKFSLDFESGVSFEDQKKAGMKSLRKACQKFLAVAMAGRRARLDKAKSVFLQEEGHHSRDQKNCSKKVSNEATTKDIGRMNKVFVVRDDKNTLNKIVNPEVNFVGKEKALCYQKSVIVPKNNDRDIAFSRFATKRGTSNDLVRDEHCAVDNKTSKLKRRMDDEKAHETRKKRKSIAIQETDSNRLEREACKDHALKMMRARSKEMQERLKAEETKYDVEKSKDARRNDLKGSMYLESYHDDSGRPSSKKKERRAETSQSSKLSKLNKLRVDQSMVQLNSRTKMSTACTRNNYSVAQECNLSSEVKKCSVSKAKLAKSLKKQSIDAFDNIDGTVNDEASRDNPNHFIAPSQLSLSSICTKSAIKRKGLTNSKVTSSVRFDATADRPKLGIVVAGVSSKGSDHSKLNATKNNKFSLSISSSQTSGISSCESGSRRRKRASGGKSKAALLAMKGFEDDGGFL